MHVEVATSNPNAGSPTDSSALLINGGTTTVGNGPVLALRNISGSKETIARLTAETVSGNNGDLTISVYAGGSTIDEKVRVQSGGGISFNGDTATANALDDYEEGTWTGSPTAGASSALTVTDEKYTKIGNQVTIACTINFSGASGALNVSGLPFNPIPAGVGIAREDSVSGYLVYGRVLSGTNDIDLFAPGTSNATPFLSSAGTFRFTMTYLT